MLRLLLCSAAFSGLAQEVSIKVLVNDDPISDYDIDQRERFLAITTQQQPSPALKKKATDMLIDERLQIQEGKKLGCTADEDDVNRILRDMASKNNLDVDGLTTALGRAGVNIKTLKDRIRAQLVWQDVMRRKFRREVQIADVDIDQAVAESGGEGGDEAENALQLRQVKFAIPAGADQRTIAAQLAAAEALRARFRMANVAELAKGVSGASVKTLAGPAGGLPAPSPLGSWSECQSRADDAAHDLSVRRRALRRLRQAFVQGRRPSSREQTQRKLMAKEMMMRAERLLRDLRQDAFIEYR